MITAGGCAVGPDYVQPAAPSVGAFTPPGVHVDLAPGADEPAQSLVVGASIPLAWYRLYQSPALDSAIQQAVALNPTITAADATLAQAREDVIQARGGYYPQADVAATAESQRGPTFVLGQQPGKPLPVYDLYTVGALASFSPDVFGATARRVEQRTSLARYQAFELAAAQLSITGNVVVAALTIASARDELAALDEIIADDEKDVALVKQKVDVGRAPRTDLLIAESQLANDRALGPPLQQRQAIAEDALAVLAGKHPADGSPPRFTLADFTLPAALPVSVPSRLVHHRPDILAAEAQLHAASAEIGVATAQMYPSVNLSATVETAATSPDALFRGAGLVWAVLGGVTAPVFHGGALAAQRRGAIDEFRASAATYQEVVLQAFGQVADAFRALDNDARLVEAERRALDVADASLSLQRLGFEAGRADILKLIVAQRSFQQARIGYQRAVAQRYLDTAQLFVAVGGGWSEDRALCDGCRQTSGSAAASGAHDSGGPDHRASDRE
jgi:NodT family efflux transporter outer membrane factor (OMF) lipoprotein